MKMLLDMLIRSEQIDIGLLILDARARVRVANPKFRRWYGFKEGDELSEKTVLGQTLRQAIRERRVVSEAVIRDEWNGNLVTVMLFAYPCEDNKQSDWAVFAADASSSRRHIRQRMLTEKVETIGQMASGTANAVLNPLAVIKGSMQMIEKHLDDFFVDEGLVGSSLHSRMRTFFRLIDDQIQRINDIIQQFLLLGKPFAMELTPLAIVDFLQHLQQRVMKKALDKQIRLSFEYPIRDGWLLAHGEYLHMALEAILDNALEASLPGAKVTVQTDVSDAYFEVRVCDEGEGIPSGMREAVFIPFVTSKEEALGLGLSVSKVIIEKMGGTIDIPEGGDGGQVRVTLPLFSFPGASNRHGHAVRDSIN